MGKGIALEFRRRFPDMYEAYKNVCERGDLRPGNILPYRKSKPWVLNFAVKDDWKHPSKVIWIEQCLEKFCDWYPKVGLKSVAFPWMGAMNGGIPLEKIQQITRRYLSTLGDINVEVYTFNPREPDPLYNQLVALKQKQSVQDFKMASGLRIQQTEVLYQILKDKNVTSLSQIAESGIFGKTSLDRLYAYLRNSHGISEAKFMPKGQLELPI